MGYKKHKRHWITALRFLTRRTTYITRDDNFIIARQGILRKREINTRLDRLDGITVNQSIIGRLLGYGDVTIETGNVRVTFTKMARPKEIKRAMES